MIIHQCDWCGQTQQDKMASLDFRPMMEGGAIHHRDLCITCEGKARRFMQDNDVKGHEARVASVD